jgi:hypothetical protein
MSGMRNAPRLSKGAAPFSKGLGAVVALEKEGAQGAVRARQVRWVLRPRAFIAPGGQAWLPGLEPGTVWKKREPLEEP